MIQILHRLNNLVAEVFVRERFAQPVKLLHDTVPGHGIVQSPLVSEVLLSPNPLVVGSHGDAAQSS